MANTTAKNGNKFLIKHPVVSEKSVAMSEDRKYVFLVEDHATVSEIKKAVEGLYGVHVIGTNVVNLKPKPKRYGRSVKLEARGKKVIVTLKEGEKLDILPH